MTRIFPSRQSLYICACLGAIVIAIYWPVSEFQFINYDDGPYVTNNSHVQRGLTLEGLVWSFTSCDGNWHPLTWLSHMLDCQLFGLKPGAHHLVNVLFHIVNTLLLFTVLNRTTGAAWRSGLVAALFALHPLHVESVAWVSERKDVLSAFFWMLTIWAYVRYAESLITPLSTDLSAEASAKEEASAKAKRSLVRRSLGEGGTPIAFYALSLLFFALGLMSKPMMVTLPFVLLLVDYWPLGRTRWMKSAVGEKAKVSVGHLLGEKLPFLALAVASSAMTFVAQRTGGGVVPLAMLPVGARVANAVVSCVRYMGKAFWPSRLAVFYPYQTWSPWAVIGSATILGAATCAALWRARREPHLIVGWLWYLGMLVPVVGLMQVGGQSMADRYTYLPLVGLFVMAAWSVPSSAVERRVPKVIAAGVAAVLLGACATLCRLQLRYWQTSETLFRHALEVTKANWVAHYNLGLAMLDAGRVQDAISHYEQALRFWPDYALGHNDLGIALAQADRVPEAVEQFNLAVRIKPDFADAHHNLALALAKLGRTREAVAEWERVLQLNPDDAGVHCDLGCAFLQLGRVQDAIEHLEMAVRLKPNYAEAQDNLGNALLQTGKTQEAIRHFEQAVRLKPDMVEAQNQLARLRAIQ